MFILKSPFFVMHLTALFYALIQIIITRKTKSLIDPFYSVVSSEEHIYLLVISPIMLIIVIYQSKQRVFSLII